MNCRSNKISIIISVKKGQYTWGQQQTAGYNRSTQLVQVTGREERVPEAVHVRGEDGGEAGDQAKDR